MKEKIETGRTRIDEATTNEPRSEIGRRSSNTAEVAPDLEIDSC
jgi:hypothetical protein